MSDLTGEIVHATAQHLLIVGVAMLVATSAGIPIGIACVRNRRSGRVVLRLIDMIQTIPSLALFGFLIPLPLIGGIGIRTAIVALISRDGRSDWLEGAQLLAAYAIIALSFFFVPG